MRRRIYPPAWKYVPGPGGYLSVLIARAHAIPQLKTICTWLLLLSLLLPLAAAADTPTKRVLVVTSYDLDRPAVMLFVQDACARPSARAEGALNSSTSFRGHQFQRQVRRCDGRLHEAQVRRRVI
jgi:hypothetical protein